MRKTVLFLVLMLTSAHSLWALPIYEKGGSDRLGIPGPEGVESFSASYRTPHGVIRAAWKRVDGKPVFEYNVPDGVEVVKQRDI